MVKMINKRVGKSLLSCLVFTEVAMKWIQKGRANRIAAYPQYLPCFDKPKEYTTLSDGGYYTERLRTNAIKTTNPKTLKQESVDVSRLIRVFVNNRDDLKRSVK